MESEDLLEFHLDPDTKVRLESGKFYLITRHKNEKGDEVWKDKLQFGSGPTIEGLVEKAGQWKIKYIFDRKPKTSTIEKMVSHISNSLRLNRNATSYFSQFLYTYKEVMILEKKYKVEKEAVGIVDGKIVVNEYPKQDTKEILDVLIQIHEISTNPDSFMNTWLYSMISPFSFEIREKQQKFPYRLASGVTHGGKSSELRLFVVRGFNQTIDFAVESMNTIKSIYTLGERVEDSRLPFIADDVNNNWLIHHAEELKGATDSTKFMVRGTKSQERIVKNMYGMPLFSMNEDFSGTIALEDRLIMSRFTAKHQKRQNKAEFERLIQKLQPGFLLKLIKETLEGKSIEDLLKDIHYSVKRDEEINQRIIDYAWILVNDLSRKLGLEFPLCPFVSDPNDVKETLKDEFLVYVMTKLRDKRDSTRFEKFYTHLPEGVVRVTKIGVNDFLKDNKLPKMKMTDLVNEFNDEKMTTESKWIGSLGKRAGCIEFPLSYIGEETLEIETDEEKIKDNFLGI